MVGRIWRRVGVVVAALGALAALVACSDDGAGGGFATGTVAFTFDEARPFVDDWGQLDLGQEYRTLVVDADGPGPQCGFEVYSTDDGATIRWTVDPATAPSEDQLATAIANVSGRWEMTGRATRQEGNDGRRVVFQPDGTETQLIFDGAQANPASPCRLDR